MIKKYAVSLFANMCSIAPNRRIFIALYDRETESSYFRGTKRYAKQSNMRKHFDDLASAKIYLLRCEEAALVTLRTKIARGMESVEMLPTLKESDLQTVGGESE